MKRLIVYLCVLALVFAVAPACKKSEEGDLGSAAEDAKQEMKDTMQNAADEAGDAAEEAGDAMQQAADDMGDAAEEAGDAMKDAANDAEGGGN